MSNFEQQYQTVGNQYNALKQVINFFLVVSPPETMDEEFLREARNKANQYLDQFSKTEISKDIEKVLFDVLKKNFGPQKATSYFKSITTYSNLINPVISKYYKNDVKALPYSSIILDLLFVMQIFFAEHDCFDLYSEKINLIFEFYNFSAGRLFTDVTGEGKPRRYYELAGNRGGSYVNGINLTYLSEAIKTLEINKIMGSDSKLFLYQDYYLELFEIDNNHKILKYFSKVWSLLLEKWILLRRLKPYNFPVLYYKNKHNEGRIIFKDKYFVYIEDRYGQRDTIRMSTEIFSAFYYGLCYDLLLILNRLQKEKELGLEVIAGASKIVS